MVEKTTHTYSGTKNAGEILEFLKTWIKNCYQLRPRERQCIEAFVTYYYVGTQTEPIPLSMVRG